MAKSKLPENWKPAEVNYPSKRLANTFTTNIVLFNLSSYSDYWVEEIYLLLAHLYKGVSSKTPKRGKLPTNWRSFLNN
jgi:hypothetical protein